MSEIDMVVQVINSCGFPIVACGVLFFLYNKTIEKFTATLTSIDTKLEKLCDELKGVCKYDDVGKHAEKNEPGNGD